MLHPLAGIPGELVAAWADLAERAAEPNPFSEPLMVLPAVRHLGTPGTPALLAVYREDRLVAATPLVHRPSWRRILWPTWATFRHDYCFSGTPLVDRDHLTEATAALRSASGHLGGCLLALEWVRLRGPVAGALCAGAGGSDRRRPRPVLYERFERAGTSPGGGRTMGKSRLRPLRRAAARLAGPGVPVPEPRERPADSGAVDDFLELERAGWKGAAGTAFACRPGHVRFLREVIAGFAAAGRIRLVSMEVGGRPVGMTWSLLGGDAEFGFKSAYDERWKSAAPGMQVFSAAVGAAAGAGLRIDSCASPEEGWLDRFMPERVAVGTLVLTPRGPTGLALSAGARAFVAVRDRRGRPGGHPPDGPMP